MSAYPLVFNQRAVGFFANLMKARSAGQKLAAMLAFRPSMMAPRITLTEGLTDPTVSSDTYLYELARHVVLRVRICA